MTEQSPIPFRWIQNDAELLIAIQDWQTKDFIVLDTEFERTNTFFAKAGLIQISDGEQIYLIDPLKINDLAVLKPLLENEQVIIVMHSMSEDVDLLTHVCDAKLNAIFDTQVAAAYLGYGLSLGYQRLVQAVLGLELDKSETRSDWLERPLSNEQLQYAAGDVFYLVRVYEKLKKELVLANYYDAVMQDAALQIDQLAEARLLPDSAYLKLRGAWDLPRAQQELLQDLVIWRDNLARQQDVPKGWVFADALLIEFSRYPPENLEQMKRAKKIKPKSIRLYGSELLEVIAQRSREPKQAFVLIDRPVKGRELESFKKLKKELAVVAQENDLDPQLLASRKMLESLVIHTQRNQKANLPTMFTAWRKTLFGQRLLAVLQA